MTELEATVRRLRDASGTVAQLPTTIKNDVLHDLADRLEREIATIVKANEVDLVTARDGGLGEAKLKRLALTEQSVRQMADGLRQVAALPDPVGEVTRDDRVPSGLRVRQVRCPLGVILMIYEARPNVTVDAFALCFKAGNVCFLKGGHEAARSNAALAELIRASLVAQHVPPDALALLTTSDRETMKRLLSMEGSIDLVIPRGGIDLIRFVSEHSRIPVVKHDRGVCHIFVDASAAMDQAIEICATAKTSAPATCNAAESVLVHDAIASSFVPRLVKRLRDDGVEVRGDAGVCRLSNLVVPAGEDDWGKEYLDLVLSLRIVADVDAAIAHIRRYGSNHTEAILTSDEATAERFTKSVQASCTIVNASTRFNDGYQLGLGAEIGISTSKIHAYGPMGLTALTTQRYVVHGTGQTR